MTSRNTTPGHQHDDAEQAADIAGERDVAEPERRHHHQRPVEAGDPRVLLAFDSELDDVEDDGVDRNEQPQEGEVLQESRQVRARFPGPEHEAELAGEIFHRGSVVATIAIVSEPIGT